MTRRLPIFAVAVLAATLASAASAAARSCPSRPHTLAKKPLGRVWHQGKVLYGCTVEYNHKPRDKKLGPWRAGTQVAFNGVDLAWTVPVRKNGKRSDRLWAANVDSAGRWLTGRTAVPPSSGQPGREARVQRLLVDDTGAAWVTRGSDVVMALTSPDTDPTPIGTLPGPLTPAGRRMLIGTFASVSAADLAATLRFKGATARATSAAAPTRTARPCAPTPPPRAWAPSGSDPGSARTPRAARSARFDDQEAVPSMSRKQNCGGKGVGDADRERGKARSCGCRSGRYPGRLRRSGRAVWRGRPRCPWSRTL